MSEEKYIPKLILKANQIDIRGFNLANNNNLCLCPDCKSPIFYIKINWGVVAECNEYQVITNRSKLTYSLREIGFSLYCAECGSFFENYTKFFYPENTLVYYEFTFDELDEDERLEMQNCLIQYNQKGSFTPRYKNDLFNELKIKIDEYEKKHLIKNKEVHKRWKKKKTN